MRALFLRCFVNFRVFFWDAVHRGLNHGDVTFATFAGDPQDLGRGADSGLTLTAAFLLVDLWVLGQMTHCPADLHLSGLAL